MGGLEPSAEGLGGVGGAEALDHITEEGLPCRLWHDGFRGGLVGVGGGAGTHLLEGMHHVHFIVPSRSPGPLHPAAELLQSGGRPPGEVGGGLGGGGVRARVPGAAGGGRGPVVVVGVAVPGGVGAAVAGAWGGGWVRAERGTGGGGGHGAAVARLVASGGAGVVDRGPGGGGWVWAAGETGSLAGPVGGGGGGRGAAVACLAAPGGAGAVVVGAGGGVLYGRRGEGEVDMGRQWRSWWRPGERERQERGLGGSWWYLGERERREWVVEARRQCVECVGAGGECAVRGGGGSAAVCGTGPDYSSRASQEASAGLGGLRVVPPGTGGGGEVPRCPRIHHIGVWWRQRLVI